MARDTASTLHQRIRADIGERIRSGAWPPGHRIPFEHELMAQYGCSRMTVNKALSPLAERGLIIRRRGAGSFVCHPRVHSVVLDIPDIQTEINGRGAAYHYELLSRKLRRPDRVEMAKLDLAASSQVLALTCLHRSNGRPFALEERVINLAAAPEAAEVDFSIVAPGAWLLGAVAWTEAEHRISAVNVPRSTATLLRIGASAACLVLERRTWRADEQITCVRLLFPGEVYDLMARFSPQVIGVEI
jgi:GntR family histidine utilization transcriptional repressor